MRRVDEPPFVVRKTKVGDKTISYVQMMTSPLPMAPAWCLTDDSLVLALSPQMARAHLSRPAEDGSLADVELVAQRLAPRDVTSISYQNLPIAHELVYSTVQVLATLGADALEKEFGVRADLSKFPSFACVSRHLSPSVSGSRVTKSSIVFESYGIGGMSVPMAALVSSLAFSNVQRALAQSGNGYDPDRLPVATAPFTPELKGPNLADDVKLLLESKRMTDRQKKVRALTDKLQAPGLPSDRAPGEGAVAPVNKVSDQTTYQKRLVESDTALNAANALSQATNPRYAALIVSVDNLGLDAFRKQQQEAALQTSAEFGKSAAQFRLAAQKLDEELMYKESDAIKSFLTTKSQSYGLFAEIREQYQKLIRLILDESIATIDDLVPKIREVTARRESIEIQANAKTAKADEILSELKSPAKPKTGGCVPLVPTRPAGK